VTAAAQHTSIETLPQDLERLFEAHHELVYRTAFRITGNAQDAEDALQTLFLRLLRRECPPDLERNPKGYLHRAAVNISLDVIKRRNRNIAETDVDVAAESKHDDSKLQECLRLALTELSPKAAEIFVLRHIEGYDNAEIAKMLGTSRGTIAVLLFRARGQLKRSIRTHLGEEK
jgi:RNA polymerase sigma-70 factor, ECF subfamily